MQFSNKQTNDAKKQVKFMAEEMSKHSAQVDFPNNYPDSILRTTNIQEVIDCCENLLSTVKPGKKYTDKDFGGNNDSIFSFMDKEPKLPKLKWLRPEEIALKED
jgi:hypothetical protein